MLIRTWSVLSFLCLSFFLSAQSTVIPSPADFLNNTYTKRFTPHYRVVDYFRHIAELSEKVNLVQYGETYERRPLIAAIISSPENLKRVEELRLNNLRRTGLLEGDVIKENTAIVYLSFGVHGNEAACTETALSVLYTLAGQNHDINAWLSNTIVILDPCLNPDGYDRYIQWNNSVSHKVPNPVPITREHDDPWPGGRVNHYYFDLNRDWAWLTQQESRQRIHFYLDWMPHIHVDFHEMHGTESYYFAPAAEPFHPYLTEWQSSFQEVIGKNHAGYFDRNGWLYYTKEHFDLFYPSYGDTYPMLSGAIGMTHEQAGTGAGIAMMRMTGDTLRLSDRIEHHHATALSTIETASKNAGQLVSQFQDYYHKSLVHPNGNYKSFIIKKGNPSGRIQDLLHLLRQQKIIFGVASAGHKVVKGYHYLTNDESSLMVEAGDIVIPVAQPRSTLLNVLFEPEAHLGDSLTYDITAWSLPMAYGLETYATYESVSYQPDELITEKAGIDASAPYAYALEWGSVASASLLAGLLKKGVQARFATSDFSVNSFPYTAGTVIITRGDNGHLHDFDSLVIHAGKDSSPLLKRIRTGYAETGKDLGSASHPLILRPEVISIAGAGVSEQSIGQVWHFFEEELKYPLDLVDPDVLESVNLNPYNVLILPEGSYRLGSELLQKIRSWVKSGGKLIVIGSAIGLLAGKEDFSIRSKPNGNEEHMELKETVHHPEPYNSTGRKNLSNSARGAVFMTDIDHTHPLSFGLGKAYWTLKTSSLTYQWLPSGGNAIFLKDKPVSYGFVGMKAYERQQQTLVAGTENMGMGRIVYLVDNPLFRSFWNSGKVLFSNALFF
jgi:hypothetical protein